MDIHGRLRKNVIPRRKFLGSISSALAFFAIQSAGISCKSEQKRNRMILSFYLDDTNPQIVSAIAFRQFLEYCNANGIKGESSFIPGYNGKSIIRENDQNQADYIDYVKQAWSKGIDSHMEIMTHNTLFNFEKGIKNEGGIHEGLWLHEPEVTIDEYYDYFNNIIGEVGKAGVKYTGLTWPGCGCEACTKRYAELREQGPLKISQAAFDALLKLSIEDKFRSRVLPVFYEASETDYGIYKRAADGKYGVYDLMPNAMDNFGIWENSTERVNPDYYLTEDGKSGIIIKHLESNAPYCMWYMHWQGLNPEKGVGWQAFRTVTSRINKHLSDKVIWMRPSDIVTAYHDAGGWDFTKSL
ncbi:MAG TPA: hypothetical protein VMV47_05065 [Bacteroidales bacterium]|nr:hypothetical protein [Bacteroidales bacterium]